MGGGAVQFAQRSRHWVRGWALWKAPTLTRHYVTGVIAIAVATTAGTALLVPVTRIDLLRFAGLAVCAAVSIELTRRIERQREYLRQQTIAYVDTKGIWSTAAVIVLPPVLASAMVVVTYIVAWFRVWPSNRPLPHRWVFGCATVLIGTQAAVAVLALGMHQYPGLPSGHLVPGLLDMAIIALACGARWICNCGLVMGVLALASPHKTIRDLFTGFSQQLLEAGSMALGLVAATVMMANPAVLGAVVLALVVMHRSVLLHQYQLESRTDAKTGLSSVKWWRLIAEREFEHARRRGGGVGLLILDIDHFKRVNDEFGHLVGDQVLAAVAHELVDEVRSRDACCRWGGEELTVVVPTVDRPATLLDIAERIRRRIERLTVPHTASTTSGSIQVTVSIGAALYPSQGLETLDDALLAADRAVYVAKESGRNQVTFPYTDAEGLPTQPR